MVEKRDEPNVDQLWQDMKKAQQEWDLAVTELKEALASSDCIPSPGGDLVVRKARTREAETASKYAATVQAYANGVLRKK